jgi:hypothetical protein
MTESSHWLVFPDLTHFPNIFFVTNTQTNIDFISFTFDEIWLDFRQVNSKYSTIAMISSLP